MPSHASIGSEGAVSFALKIDLGELGIQPLDQLSGMVIPARKGLFRSRRLTTQLPKLSRDLSELVDFVGHCIHTAPLPNDRFGPEADISTAPIVMPARMTDDRYRPEANIIRPERRT